MVKRLLPFLILTMAAAAPAAHPQGKAVIPEIEYEMPPAPVFEYRFKEEASEYVSLELIEYEANRVTDYDEWFWDHYYPAVTYHGGGVNDAIRGFYPPDVPGIVTAGGRELHLYQVIYGPDYILSTYGEPPNRFGVVLDPTLLVSRDYYGNEEPRWAVDFLSWAYEPGNAGSSLVFQALGWAEERNGVLYVSHYHRTYAESSRGLNAYITAIDLDDMSILWRSRPLVSNSSNFLVIGDTIITGYGFTSEPDYIHLLDRRTGEVYDSIEVRTAPEYMVRDGDTLYVRCYDANYEFRILRRG